MNYIYSMKRHSLLLDADSLDGLIVLRLRGYPILSSQVVSLPFQSVIHPEDSSL